MKNMLLFFFLMGANIAYPQLFIGSSQYVYVKNEVVYVAQDVNIGTGSNFYLRNEGQLLQGSTTVSANKGPGTLSVFQEGNSNSFAYNYWCSPVGNASAATGNENFGISLLGRPTSVTGFTPALTTTNVNGIASPLTISSYWIYRFLSSSTASGWVYAGNTTTIGAGEGFTMKGTSGTDNLVVEGNAVQNNPGNAQRYDFRGKPNDGNINVNVAAGGFTLTGNPYPSALHLNAFLLDPSNSASTGIAYFYEQDKTVNSHVFVDYKGGYGTYSPVSLASSGIYVPPTFNTYNIDGSVNTVGTTSGTAMARKYSPIGQGFMVEGATNGTLTLRNSHRAYYRESTLPNSYFNRMPQDKGENEFQNDTGSPVPQIRINTSINDTYSRQLVLALLPEATDGIDRGLDAHLTDVLGTDICFLLNNEKFVIQGVAFDSSKRLPMVINVTDSASFSIQVAEVLHFDTTQPIYIYDAVDGTYHEITGQSYTFQLNEGIYEDRFELTFDNTVLNLPTEQLTGVYILQDNSNKRLTITNQNAHNLILVSGFDILCRQVFKEKMDGTAPTFQRSTAGLSTGVYFINVVGADNEMIVKKIIVK